MTNGNIYDGSIESGEPISGFSDLEVTLYDILDATYFNFNLPAEKSTTGYVIGGWWMKYTESSASDNGSYIDSVIDPTDSTGEDVAMRFYVNGVVDSTTQEDYLVLAYYEYSTGASIAANDYTLRGRIYVKDFVALEGQSATANMQVVLNNGSTVLCNVAIDNKECGKWIEFKEKVTIADGTTFTNFRLQMQYSGSNTDVTSLDYTEFYIDDLYISTGYTE